MEDQYDEFGNFIGEVEEEDGADSVTNGTNGYHDGQNGYGDPDGSDQEEADAPLNHQALMHLDDDDGLSNAVVLHEDKHYYPTAREVYGPDVETLVQEEDAQQLSEPIIAPIEERKFLLQEADLPPVFFDRRFMIDLMDYPDQNRNIAFAGHLHHGKTALMDMLVLETHDLRERLAKRTGREADEQLRYTDVHVVERARGISTKASPMSLVLQSARGKSHLINIIDTPGHVDFVDEVGSTLRLMDGVVLVVDVVEGVQVNTERIIRHCVLESLPMVLVINKMDRLILELKIPPSDAYFKLKHVVEEVNTVIENTIPGKGESLRISPERGNVAFACSSMGWCFTLPSFAKMYADTHSQELDVPAFAQRLWGDIFFNPKSRKMTRRAVEERAKRTFVHFVLEPIYKLYSHTISESPEDLKDLLQSLGISLKPMQLRSDAKDLLKLVCERFFGPAVGLVDMVVAHIPSPIEGAERFVKNYYTGPRDTPVGDAMVACDPKGPLMIHISKLFNSPDATSFDAFGRILSGTIEAGQTVRVLGEGYSPEDDEDTAQATVSGVSVANTRYNVPVSGMTAGNLCLLSGVDNSIVKTATIMSADQSPDEQLYTFRPITHLTESVFKLAVEPIQPSELPKLLSGLRKLSKSYPLIRTLVEESGEHVIFGTGELYMDCALHDLRKLYADMEMKVSDPVTRFQETLIETSAIKCYAKTPNKANKITMIAEPLDDGIAEDIEAQRVSIHDPVRKVGKFFQEEYGWDLLASRSIWAFGPEDTSPNILQDDTLPTETDKKLLATAREGIRQGFQWATRNGPLCEEPIRNARFKITDVQLSANAMMRGRGQIIPTARRCVYSAFLTGSPRLLEPIYAVSATMPVDAIPHLQMVFGRRRGHVLSETPVAGTPLYRVRGLIPVIDSFGFETDVRIHSQGQALLSLVFDRWEVVPGDPLDREVRLGKLEVATGGQTARDFVLKTRRRKGLNEEIGIGKFLEPELVQSLKESGLLDGR